MDTEFFNKVYMIQSNQQEIQCHNAIDKGSGTIQSDSFLPCKISIYMPIYDKQYNAVLTTYQLATYTPAIC